MNTLAAILFAQLALLGSSSTNIVLVSSNVLEKAWERKVVMKDGAGNIINDDNKVGNAAVIAAADAAAESAGEISLAASFAMTNALATLSAAKQHAATNAIALALVVPPETDRTNLTAYVVKTETIENGTRDKQWVYFNKDIALEPNRFVVYETFDSCSTNKVTWLNWTNKVTVVQNGRTWQGCRVCTVARPTWAVGVPCLDLPNDKWGGPTGIEWGDILLTSGGVPLYTGFVTNGITGDVAYFDNGFFKGFKTEEE